MNEEIKMTENTQTESVVTTNTSTEEAAANKTYSQAEVDAMIQSEADRRVNQAMSKKEREMAKKLTEAEKLAKMSEEDKYRYQLEQKEQELAAKEREFTLRDNKIAAMKVMAEKSLPVELVDFVVNEDANIMDANIKLLDKYIKNAIASEVKTRLASPTPKAGLASDTEYTKESFAKMGYKERLDLQRNNPELYKKLAGK